MPFRSTKDIYVDMTVTQPAIVSEKFISIAFDGRFFDEDETGIEFNAPEMPMHNYEEPDKF